MQEQLSKEQKILITSALKEQCQLDEKRLAAWSKSEFSNEQLRVMLRNAAERISEGDVSILGVFVSGLVSLGFEASAYEGKGHLMDSSEAGQRILYEWLIGQIIDISQNSSYHCVNSWCNWVLSQVKA